MTQTVITSFTREGFDLYGKDCVESFLDNWHPDVNLVVYYEGSRTEFPNYSGVDYESIWEVQGLSTFFDAIRPFPMMTGTIAGKYNINYDVRMARKSFMLRHALKTYGGRVVWLDGDTVTHTKVPENFLDVVLPDEAMCCFLGRDNWYYTESGFLGYNGGHPSAVQFTEEVVKLFTTGIIFTQPGWHDCIAFDLVRKRAIELEPERAHWFNNLSGSLPHGTMHPFVNSILGSFMDHKKGQRKGKRSTQKDLIQPREERYWKDNTVR